MRIPISLVTAGAILFVLSTTPLGNAASIPVEMNESAKTLVSRGSVPRAFKIGLLSLYYSNSEDNEWVAWIDGEDPCTQGRKTFLEVKRKDYDSPCNLRFSVEGFDYQYSMFGCEASGWNDVHLMRNGKDRVAECVRDKQNMECLLGNTFKGEWRCDLKDPS
jgi:hypothetical protein